MRLLFVIPHFFGQSSATPRHGSEQSDPRPRIKALADCICALHQLFGSRQCFMNIEKRRTENANHSPQNETHVAVCTAGSQHLLDQLPLEAGLFHHVPTDVDPPLLGFQCHSVMRDRWGNFDYYCYLEDDLILHDPWLFAKLAWFNGHVGHEKLLLPNRFERGRGLMHKAYVDGELARRVTQPFQNVDEEPTLESEVLGRSISFRRPTNPHSGCFFLNHGQMERWMGDASFLKRETTFIGPLESAATLSIMRTFQVYKPDRESADFLEIEHFGDQFIRQLRQ